MTFALTRSGCIKTDIGQDADSVVVIQGESTFNSISDSPILHNRDMKQPDFWLANEYVF